MTKRQPSDSLVNIDTAALASYKPDDSASTQAALPVIAAPVPPPPIAPVGLNGPDESYTLGMTPAKAQARAKRQIHEIRHIWLGIAVVLIVITTVAGLVLTRTVNAQQATYARSQFTGWVGHSSTGQPVSITILPCQHLPCLNISLDLTVPHTPTKADPSTTTTYLLGGQYLGGNEVYVAGRYGGIDIIADITTTDPVVGVITSGYAHLTLTFKQLNRQTIYDLHSATVTEQHAIFGK